MGRDPSSQDLNVWECVNCGEHVPLDETICTSCGADQDGYVEEDLEDAEDEDAVEE